MNVIGLTGLPGSGKSTVANYLVREHGYTQLSFAGPLKDMLRAVDPYLAPARVTASGRTVSAGIRLSDAIELYPHDTEAFLATNFPEYPRLLDALAELHGPGYWIGRALRELTDDGKYVFDDVSSPLQADIIKDFNPWGLWHVVRPDLSVEEIAGLGEYQIIGNVSSLGFLQSEVDRALARFLDSELPRVA